MSVETTASGSLQDIKTKVDEASISAQEARKDFLEKLQMAGTIVREYNQRRLDIFQAKLQEHRLTWCSRCGNLVSVDMTKLLYSTGVERRDSGDGYGFESFSRIFRSCQICEAELNAKHGWYGQYDTSARAQASSFVYLAEERADGFYSGGKKIERVDSCGMTQMPSKLFAELCTRWSIPPELSVNGEGKIIEKK